MTQQCSSHPDAVQRRGQEPPPMGDASQPGFKSSLFFSSATKAAAGVGRSDGGGGSPPRPITPAPCCRCRGSFLLTCFSSGHARHGDSTLSVPSARHVGPFTRLHLRVVSMEIFIQLVTGEILQLFTAHDSVLQFATPSIHPSTKK
jgi:hypothetical protein